MQPSSILSSDLYQIKPSDQMKQKSQQAVLFDELYERFPSLFKSGEEGDRRLDLERFKTFLGEDRVREKYGLRWENKPEQFDVDSVGKLPGLQRIPSKSIRTNPDRPTHVLIEGDNYHALQVLAYTHTRAVDVIYIDPPYNTGNKDFKYNDRFVDKEDGYRHSKWLSFMSKRLKIAKTLLKETGVIFISIDDNEQAPLKLLCDEIFGEENFVDPIIWNGGKKNNARLVSNGHEYVFVYAKSKNSLIKRNITWRVKKPGVDLAMKVALKIWENNCSDPDSANKEWQLWLKQSNLKDGITRFKWLDEHVKERGPVRIDGNIASPGGNGYLYTIYHEKTGRPCAFSSRGWRYAESTMQRLIGEGRIHFGLDESRVPSVKTYLGESSSQVLESIFQKERQAAAKTIAEIGLEGKFPYPKDLELMRLIIGTSAPENAIVLDFFAGSGTTGHAVMQLNAEDGGSRQCILVTNDEGEFKDEAGNTMPGGICTHVTYPRLQKVIQGYTTPKGKVVDGLGENLEFFKTRFEDLPRTRNQTQAFAKACTSILELKSGCYDMLEETQAWSLYKSADKHVFILYDDIAVENAVNRLGEVSGLIEAYVFSYEQDDDTEELLSKLSNVKIQKIPSTLVELFRRIKG